MMGRSVVSRIFDRVGAGRAWLRGRFRSGGVILMYHRIGVPDADPWQLAVSPEHFNEHLQVLKRRALALRVRDLAAALRRGVTPRRFLVVTFDDGYADNLAEAKPLLERHDVPATVFIASGWLGRRAPFWWDELQDLILLSKSLPESLKIEMPDGPWRYRLGRDATGADEARRLSRGWRAYPGPAPTERHLAYLAIHAFLSSRGPSECEEGMSQLRSQIPYSAPLGGGESGRPLTPQELTKLGEGELVEIGAHSRTHARLARLTREEQRREIVGSREALEDMLGASVTSFAYPFGGKEDFTAETASIVREEGFAAACATTRGTVRAGADLWRLPRFHVVDSDGDQLDRRISQWFAA
jgi:peptidoglycan/xylan/chitin deacetylase (PgdA/CDA1 family)